MDIQPDTPSALLPDLTAWGIEEYDRGICLDTYENRLIIRENECRWQVVFDDEGKPTPYIQVITPAMRAARTAINKALILSDDRNVNSDYLTGEDLLFEPDSKRTVPGWVLAATRKWIEVERQRQTEPNYRPSLVSAPGGCVALRLDGERCANWHGGRIDEGGYCKTHIANRPGQANQPTMLAARARHRLDSATLAAVDKLEQLLNADGEPTQLNAAKEILDRAGVRGGIEIDQKLDIKVIPSAEIVRDRLLKLKKGQEERAALLARMSGEQDADLETVDAEIVEEELEP